MYSELFGAVPLIILTYLLPLFSTRVRRSGQLLAAFIIVLTAHHVLSLFNIFLAPVPGTEYDANDMHRAAAAALADGRLPIDSIGTGTYAWILYFFYTVFGASKLVGQTVSVLVATATLLYITGLARQLGIRDDRWLALTVVVTGLVPSFWFFTSFTFREPFQALGLAAGVYHFLSYLEAPVTRRLIASWLWFLFMGLFHHVLLAFAFVLVELTALVVLWSNRGSWRWAMPLAFASIFLIGVVGWATVMLAPASHGNNYLEILTRTGGVSEMITRYRRAVDSNLPRSTYGYTVDASTPRGLVAGLSQSYGSYIFGPVPSSVRNHVDWVPALNAMARWVAVALVIAGFWRRGKPVAYPFLSVVYLLTTLMWSLGTTNYGQAFRHNAISDWLLFLLAASVLFHFFHRARLPDE